MESSPYLSPASPSLYQGQREYLYKRGVTGLLCYARNDRKNGSDGKNLRQILKNDILLKIFSEKHLTYRG